MEISTLQALNCKKFVSRKIQKVHLLSSFTSQNTLATFFRFISSVFSLCIETRLLGGIKNGVSNKSLSENPKAFFKHCFGCALNLAVGDILKNVRFLKDSMGTTYEISNLIKRSSKIDGMLQKIQKYISLSTI